jgi:hypothetical protein
VILYKMEQFVLIENYEKKDSEYEELKKWIECLQKEISEVRSISETQRLHLETQVEQLRKEVNILKSQSETKQAVPIPRDKTRTHYVKMTGQTAMQFRL